METEIRGRDRPPEDNHRQAPGEDHGAHGHGVAEAVAAVGEQHDQGESQDRRQRDEPGEEFGLHDASPTTSSG